MSPQFSRKTHESSPADRSPPAWPPGEARSPPWSRWAGSATRPGDTVSASLTSASKGRVKDTLHVEHKAGQHGIGGEGGGVVEPLLGKAGAVGGDVTLQGIQQPAELRRVRHVFLHLVLPR